jgi:hypothetical protein
LNKVPKQLILTFEFRNSGLDTLSWRRDVQRILSYWCLQKIFVKKPAGLKWNLAYFTLFLSVSVYYIVGGKVYLWCVNSNYIKKVFNLQESFLWGFKLIFKSIIYRKSYHVGEEKENRSYLKRIYLFKLLRDPQTLKVLLEGFPWRGGSSQISI